MAAVLILLAAFAALLLALVASGSVFAAGRTGSMFAAEAMRYLNAELLAKLLLLLFAVLLQPGELLKQ
jgi:hypothetical protein